VRKALDDLAVGSSGKRLIHQTADPPRRSASRLQKTPSYPAMSACDGFLGRALPGNERQARLSGSFLAWFHGERDGAGDRGPGLLPGICQVISLSGDGGFSMLMGDFLSLVQLAAAA